MRFKLFVTGVMMGLLENSGVVGVVDIAKIM